MYYIYGFGDKVYGPFLSDEALMAHAEENNHGLLSIHDSKESAEKEAQSNKKYNELQDNMLLNIEGHFTK